MHKYAHKSKLIFLGVYLIVKWLAICWETLVSAFTKTQNTTVKLKTYSNRDDVTVVGIRSKHFLHLENNICRSRHLIVIFYLYWANAASSVALRHIEIWIISALLRSPCNDDNTPFPCAVKMHVATSEVEVKTWSSCQNKEAEQYVLMWFSSQAHSIMYLSLTWLQNIL